MLSIDAPLTCKIAGETLDRQKTAMLAFIGKFDRDLDFNVETFEKLLVTHLKNAIANICDCKTIGREVYYPDSQPVWNPEQIDFRKVPLNYFLDAIYLFWHGSYRKNHPYYQTVVDLYGEKPGPAGLGKEISEKTMRKINFNLKTISTLLQWSPTERQMLGDEAERDCKRIKTTLF
jgi:hypothetical protein